MDQPIISFEHLPVTTTTVIIPLSGEITSCINLFSLFEVTFMEIPEGFRLKSQNKRKFIIPFCDTPGAILSLRYQGMTRGIITSLNSSHFKNSITMDISTRVKNVNLKLSPETIQLCGAKSLDVATEAARHVLAHANKIQSELTFMTNNPDLVEKAIIWMDNTRDDDDTITLPWFDVDEKKEGRIIKFLYSLATDHVKHSSMMTMIRDYYTKVENVCNHLSIQHNLIRCEMTNYNYDTGFNINRRKLYECVNKLNDMGKVPFIAQYWCQVYSYVSVFLPIESDVARPRGKRRKSTIMIYRSGHVTCSTKDPYQGERFYNMFGRVIMFLQAFINTGESREYKI